MGTWDVPDAQAAMPGLLPAGGSTGGCTRRGRAVTPPLRGSAKSDATHCAHSHQRCGTRVSHTTDPMGTSQERIPRTPSTQQAERPGGAARRAQEGALSAGCLAASPQAERGEQRGCSG